MSPRYRPGEPVRVRAAWPRGHIRTPWYIRGRQGRVERVVGSFPDPERLAYGEDGLPPRMLYRVRFAQPEVWPDYGGPSHDTLDIEIYEHWLEPTDSAHPAAGEEP
jgi:nitrile hydratase subunit beta